MRGWRTVGLVLVLAATARADPGRKVVRFDGDHIDGELVRPEGDLVAARPVLDLPSLLGPPTSFDHARRRTRLAAAAALGQGEGHGTAKHGAAGASR